MRSAEMKNMMAEEGDAKKRGREQRASAKHWKNRDDC
jgi:hypothetical protein